MTKIYRGIAADFWTAAMLAELGASATASAIVGELVYLLASTRVRPTVKA